MTSRPARQTTTPAIIARLLFGLVLIGLGMTLLGVHFGWLTANTVLALAWPLALLLPGIVLLTHRRHPQNLVGGALVLAAACAFAGQMQWIRVNPWVACGPILIVLMGGSVMWRALRTPRV